jgi:hypothetical protein
MDTYRVISDVSSVPEMTDLEVVRVESPARKGAVFGIDFSANYQMNLSSYEPAVGVTCRVVRTRDGQDQECRGSVGSVTPLSISVNGEGFH